MTPNKIIIEVKNGMVESVYATDPNLKFIVVDHDNEEGDLVCGEQEPDGVFKSGNGYKMVENTIASEELKKANF